MVKFVTLNGLTRENLLNKACLALSCLVTEMEKMQYISE